MQTTNTVPVWDIAVRSFHWSLVATYTIAWISEDIEDLHVIAGYAVLALICFRVIWGLIGSKHARFSDFIYSATTIKQYLKSLLLARPKHYLGHNPAGGVMVIALLLSLFGTTLSGLKLYGVEGYGPLAESQNTLSLAALNPIASAYANGDEKEDSPGEELWEDIHEFFANISLFLVFVHILGVLFSSMLENENLTKAMINGRKKIPSDEAD